MAVLPTGIGPVTGGYQIQRSLRFNSADSAYLNRTFTTPTDGKRWTWSGWVKRGILTNGTGTAQQLFSAGSALALFRFSTTDTLVSGWTGAANLETTQVFRDASAWYHIMLVVDTTQATASNRVKYYVNGSQITAFSSTDYPTQNSTTVINSAVAHNIGAYTSSTQYVNGYLTEINFIDGQALTPSSFGQSDPNTGVWSPIKYSGTYGTNGFYLNFSDNSNTTAATLGKDYSGNGNNWTPNNFSVTAGAGNDSLVDTPTPYGTDTGVGGEVRGNYATWNPLDKDDGITSVTNGNLNVVTNGSNGSIKSTIAFPSGKWYWEVTSDSVNSGGTQAIGIMPQSQPPTNNMSDSGKLGYALDVSNSDRKFENGTATSYGTYTQANGAIYMLAFDQDAGKLWYGIDGTWLASGAPASGTNPSSSSIPTTTAYCAAVSDNTVSGTFTVNFGNRAFAYTAPSGFKALCTQNLPTPTIGATSTTQAGKYFNTVLWTGNDATRTITGYGFQPDFIWTKGRSVAAGHRLSDAVRGASGGTMLNLNTATTDAENTDTAITGFASDGFTMNGSNHPNVSPYTYVGWGWNGGGSNATNTSGTITSTVRANTTAGFSIVTYTGTGTAATVGHGLGVAPSLIIVKVRANGGANTAWHVYSSVLGNGSYLVLNTTAASDTGSIWNNTSPTSTVFSIGSSAWPQVNNNTGTYVAYCFAPIADYSAFGSYTGNGSTDGPFCYLGFRPAFVMLKRTDSTSNWTILDFQREGYNVDNDPLYPNLSDAEGTADLADLLSNGFKLRSTDTSVNANGGTYVYAAFAQNPFKYSLAR